MTDDPIRAAIVQLKRLPGVGEKTATRFVYWLLRKPEIATAMASALSELEERVVEAKKKFFEILKSNGWPSSEAKTEVT